MWNIKDDTNEPTYKREANSAFKKKFTVTKRKLWGEG